MVLDSIVVNSLEELKNIDAHITEAEMSRDFEKAKKLQKKLSKFILENDEYYSTLRSA